MGHTSVTLVALCMAVAAPSVPHEQWEEKEYNDVFCTQVCGKRETSHPFRFPTGQSHIKVDCETLDTVYEGGLDKRRSLDSVQQALFAASLTGKRPIVVIYDTDGRVGKWEHRIRVGCERARVDFCLCRREAKKLSCQHPCSARPLRLN